MVTRIYSNDVMNELLINNKQKKWNKFIRHIFCLFILSQTADMFVSVFYPFFSSHCFLILFLGGVYLSVMFLSFILLSLFLFRICLTWTVSFYFYFFSRCCYYKIIIVVRLCFFFICRTLARFNCISKQTETRIYIYILI